MIYGGVSKKSYDGQHNISITPVISVELVSLEQTYLHQLFAYSKTRMFSNENTNIGTRYLYNVDIFQQNLIVPRANIKSLVISPKTKKQVHISII